MSVNQSVRDTEISLFHALETSRWMSWRSREGVIFRFAVATARQHIMSPTSNYLIRYFIRWQKPNSRTTGRSPCGDNKPSLLTTVLTHLAIGQSTAPPMQPFPQPSMRCPLPACSMRLQTLTDSSCSRSCRTKVNSMLPVCRSLGWCQVSET